MLLFEIKYIFCFYYLLNLLALKSLNQPFIFVFESYGCSLLVIMNFLQDFVVNYKYLYFYADNFGYEKVV